MRSNKTRLAFRTINIIFQFLKTSLSIFLKKRISIHGYLYKENDNIISHLIKKKIKLQLIIIQ